MGKSSTSGSPAAASAWSFVAPYTCEHPDRSTAGLSVLARRGYRDLTLVDGGLAAWSEANFATQRGS